jgi:anti-sigma factor RsiW
MNQRLTMACDSWKAKLDIYLDGELPAGEMRAFDVHVRNCPSCAADALARVQMKRAVQVAGKRFTPSAEFRNRIQQKVSSKPQRSFRWAWAFTAAVVVILAAGVLTSNHLRSQSAQNPVFSEIADPHVETLASSSPVDVISTDRHTVKPWFQGKIPFAFNLPELQNTDFTLVGGRMTYLDQTPGAHLIYDIRKHHISVFIFPEQALHAGLDAKSENPKQLAFNMETWGQSGLRFFVIGDTSPADIDNLAKLFKAAAAT